MSSAEIPAVNDDDKNVSKPGDFPLCHIYFANWVKPLTDVEEKYQYVMWRIGNGAHWSRKSIEK